MPDPTEKLSWRLCSAKLDASLENRERLEQLLEPTRDFRRDGAFFIWHTRNRIAPEAFDVLYGQVSYEKIFHGGVEGLKESFELLASPRSCRSVTCRLNSAAMGCDFKLEFSRALSGEVLASITNYGRDLAVWPVFVKALKTLNFIPNYEIQDLNDGKTSLTPVHSPPSDYAQRRFSFRGPDDQSYSVYFADDEHHYPKSAWFFYGPDPDFEQILRTLGEVHKHLGGSPANRQVWDRLEVWDRPSDERGQELPPPDGVWNCIASARYKEGFDPYERPNWLQQSTRFPILQSTTEGKDLAWQVDLVHTLDECFYDIQSSEGIEFLEGFLAKHNLPGKIWDGAFEDRWHITADSNPRIVLNDVDQGNRIVRHHQ